MMIKDLEMRKDLAAEELSAVRGGTSNSIHNGDLFAPVTAANGPGVFSPQTVVSTPVYAPTNVLQDSDTTVDLDNKLATVIGSFGTFIGQ